MDISFLSGKGDGSSVSLASVSELTSRLLMLMAEITLAAKDVLVEGKSFSELAKYLEKFRPILMELGYKSVSDKPSVRVALESLERKLKLVKELIHKCSSKSRFYLLINCRSIVKEITSITNEIGRCLTLIPISNLDISMEVREKITSLQKSMINAQFKTAVKEEEVLDKVNSGLKVGLVDRNHANEMLLLIAGAVGIKNDSRSWKQELEQFRNEKEEAEILKKESEALELQQIIAFLSQADAVQPVEQEIENSMQKNSLETQKLAPLKSFICPLTKNIMEDPVDITSGLTFERSAIEDWFLTGNKVCPVTSRPLQTVELKPNYSLHKSICEWKERNTLANIAAMVRKLQHDDDEEILIALLNLQNLSKDSPIHREWIRAEGAIPILAQLLYCFKGDIKKQTFTTLQSIAFDNGKTKEEIAKTGALIAAVRSLAQVSEEGRQAVALLLNLSENPHVCQQIGRVQGCILLLVAMLNCGNQEAAEDAAQLLSRLSNDSQNVLQMAESNYFKPLLQCLSEGCDKTKILMASAIAKMELTDHSKRALAHEGAIMPLVNTFLSENFEAKLVALKALQQLSTLPENVQLMINAGIVPHLLKLVFVVKSSMVTLREPAARLMENLAIATGIPEQRCSLAMAFLENEIIGQLLFLLKTSCSIIQGHLLRTFQGITCLPTAYEVRVKMRESGAMQYLLPFFHSRNQELRICSLKLLFILSQDGSGNELVSKFGKQEIISFIRVLLESVSVKEKSSVLGIVSNLPINDSAITEALLEADALSEILNAMKIDCSDATTQRSVRNQLMENAAGALIRFTLPSNRRLQHLIAEHGTIPLLVQLLIYGTPVSKAKAAISLAQLSKNSFALTKRVTKGQSWFCFSPHHSSVCKLHGGHCSVKASFCLVEAGAIFPLVEILNGKDQEAYEAALDALATIFSEETWERGVSVLYEANGITPMVKLLCARSADVQEKVLWISEKIFRSQTCRLEFGSQAQISLIELAQNVNSVIKSLAGKVLAHLKVQEDNQVIFNNI